MIPLDSLNTPPVCPGTRLSRPGHMTAPLLVLLCLSNQTRAVSLLVALSGGLL